MADTSSSSPQGPQIVLETFVENRGDGTSFEGAALIDPRPRTFFKPPRHLVRAAQGVELRLWFGPVKLEEAMLEMVLDATEVDRLYRAYGQDQGVMDTNVPLAKLRFKAQLVPAQGQLLRMAKRAPAGAGPEVRLEMLVRELPELLDSLEPWALHKTTPVAEGP